MFKQFMLLVVFASTLTAQDAPPDEPSLELQQAMWYTFADVVLQNERFREDLTDGQKERIKLLHDIYYKEYNDYVNQTLVIEGDQDTIGVFGRRITDNRQTPEDIANLKQMDVEFDRQLRGELIPEQIDAAEKRVLQRRYETAGLLALAQSSDLQIVRQTGLPLSAISATLKESLKEADKEIQVLEDEVDRFVVEARKKIDKIRKEKEQQVLRKLGTDGAKLLELVE
jgi:hypothetical protein